MHSGRQKLQVKLDNNILNIEMNIIFKLYFYWIKLYYFIMYSLFSAILLFNIILLFGM